MTEERSELSATMPMLPAVERQNGHTIQWRASEDIQIVESTALVYPADGRLLDGCLITLRRDDGRWSFVITGPGFEVRSTRCVRRYKDGEAARRAAEHMALAILSCPREEP